MKVMTVIVFALLLVAPPATSQVPDDKLIVPGERIGQWTLKMGLREFLANIGSSYREERTRLPRATAYHFPQRNLVVISCTMSQRLVQIGLYRGEVIFGGDLGWKSSLKETLEQYKTAEGIGLNSPLSAVIQAYGPPGGTVDFGGGYKGYVFRGLYVNVDPQERISYIAISAGLCREDE